MRQEFSGTERLYSPEGVKKLQRATVTVIGIGGVGSWIAEALARTAVGNLILVDLDDICVTNINRQIHSTSETVGKLKVDAMAERIQLINPDCKVTTIADFINRENISQVLSVRPDYVVDAIDNARVKAALIYYCKRNKLKIITVGGAGAQIDPLKITVSDLSKTWQDPLSAKVRNELRRNYNFTKNPKRRFGIECVYSTEQLLYPDGEGNISYQKQSAMGASRLDCAQGLGASVAVTSTFGMVAASRIINWLISKKNHVLKS